MSLGAIVGGTLFNRAIAISVSRNVRNFVGWFEISSSPDDLDRIPIEVNDRVQIVGPNNEVLMTGNVERISVSYSADGHRITASGRDVTADLVDSTLRTKQYQGPISFDGFVNRVMSEQQVLFPLDVQVTGIGDVGEKEIISGDIGERVMDFLERYARRVQVVLTSGPDGSVVILRSGKQRSPQTILNVPGLPINNVLSSEVDVNFAHRFGEYSCLSQLSSASGGVTVPPDNLVSQGGNVKDNSIRSTRFYEFEAETPMDSARAKDRVSLEANLRAARSLRYTAVIQGIKPDIQINQAIGVRDRICGLDDVMLVSGVRYSFSLRSGSTTEVQCTFRNAYSLEASLQARTEARSENAEDFVR